MTHHLPSQAAPTLLIGSTGPLGRALLTEAAETDVPIRAFARNPAALSSLSIDAVRGDVRDRDSLTAALEGISQVICVLGSRPGKNDTHLLEEGTRNLLAAMGDAGAPRLIVVTGMGAGSSRGHGPFWYDALVRPTILRGVYADKEAQERLVMASELNWTIVRPAVLSEKPHMRTVIAKGELAPREKMGALTRDDVARFLLSELAEPEFTRQIAHVYTEKTR
ncbi:MAG: flavin reductase [Aeromicrobium sp.]|nr:MAG: flavin reductase [Aeromicrobium sp.]